MSNSSEHEIIAGFRSDRWELIELLSIAVLIALSVSLFSRIVYDSISETWSLFIASISIILSAALILTQRLRKLSHTFEFEGFLLTSKDDHLIRTVPGYRLAESISMYQKSAFEENKALHHQWKNEPLEEYLTYDKEDEVLNFDESIASYQLLTELLEYFIIEELSTHLTDYFNQDNFDRSNLKEYSRSDIPQLLLNNRFLELFSRPMQDRPAFSDHEDPERVVMTGGFGQPLFSRFDLVLPSESVVKRLDDSRIEIDGKYLRIVFNATWTGAGAVLPPLFKRYYLGIKSWKDNKNIDATTVEVTIGVHFKYSGLLTRTGWEHYKWVGPFISKVRERVDREFFFDRINWPMIEAMMRCRNPQSKEGVTENNSDEA